MRNKKSLLIAVLLVLSMLFTGCGPNTVGFMSHIKDMQKVSTTKPTQTVSTLTISNTTFPTGIMGNENPVLIQSITDMFNKYSFVLTQQIHPTKDTSSVTIDMIQKGTKIKEHFATIQYKNKAFALLIGPKLKEVLANAPQEVQLMANAFDQKVIPLSVIEQQFQSQNLMLNTLTNRDSLLHINQKSIRFLDDFINIYQTMDYNVINKEGNSYVFQMNATDFIQFINIFVSHSIQNKDAVFNATLKFYESLTDEEFNMLYGNILPISKDEIIATLSEAIQQPLPEGTLEEWNNLYTSQLAPVISNATKGSSVRMRTWKENDKYFTNTYIVLKIADLSNPNVTYGSTILAQEEMSILPDSFDITMPTEVISNTIIEALAK